MMILSIWKNYIKKRRVVKRVKNKKKNKKNKKNPFYFEILLWNFTLESNQSKIILFKLIKLINVNK